MVHTELSDARLKAALAKFLRTTRYATYAALTQGLFKATSEPRWSPTSEEINANRRCVVSFVATKGRLIEFQLAERSGDDELDRRTLDHMQQISNEAVGEVLSENMRVLPCSCSAYFKAGGMASLIVARDRAKGSSTAIAAVSAINVKLRKECRIEFPDDRPIAQVGVIFDESGMVQAVEMIAPTGKKKIDDFYKSTIASVSIPDFRVAGGFEHIFQLKGTTAIPSRYAGLAENGSWLTDLLHDYG